MTGADGKSYEIAPELLKIEQVTVTEHGERFIVNESGVLLYHD